MPRFRYVGPFAEVEIPALRVVVKQGEEFDAPEGHGLDGQDIYEPVSPTKPATPAADTQPEG